jgi:hypothetical protein
MNYLSLLSLQRLHPIVSVHVWSVRHEVDQGPAVRSQSHICLRRAAEVDEREVGLGSAFHFRSDGELIQPDVYKESLNRDIDGGGVQHLCQLSWEKSYALLMALGAQKEAGEGPQWREATLWTAHPVPTASMEQLP